MDNKALISHLAHTLELPEADVRSLLKATAHTLASLGQGCDSLSVPRFGTFEAVKTPEREAVSPDGRLMLEPPAITLHFTASAALRKRAGKGGGAKP